VVRKIKTETGEVKIDRDTEAPRWIGCTEAEWMEKAEIARSNGDIGKALMYADYANCREMYDNGLTIKQIQNRFTETSDDDEFTDGETG